MYGKGFFGPSIEKCQEILLLLWVQSGTILRNEFTFTRSKQHALNFNKKTKQKSYSEMQNSIREKQKKFKGYYPSSRDKNKEQNAGGSTHDFRLN